MSEKKTLETMIAAEEKKLAKLEEKQAEITKKIKARRANITKYTMMKNNQQFNDLSNVLDGKGISIEDIMAVLSSGDMRDLQSKMESGAANEVTEEESKDNDTTV